jgi:hypothetical protein
MPFLTYRQFFHPLSLKKVEMKTETKQIDVVVSFDTTGSMYPCLTSVRRRLADLLTRLHRKIPGIRLAVIAHGDYCDEGNPYVTRILDFSTDAKKIVSFVMNVEPTGGGGYGPRPWPECYELVLRQAQGLNWQSPERALVVIGDDVPHGLHDHENKNKIDWQGEASKLAFQGVKVYGVQALGNRYATPFYTNLAAKTGGKYLTLSQFEDVADILEAVCLKEAGDLGALSEFEKELIKAHRMGRSMASVFENLYRGTGVRVSTSVTSFSTHGLVPVAPSRFQIFGIDSDTPIADFVRGMGITFQKGRGFYQFTKPETIQDYKEIILVDRVTGDMFTGIDARSLLGLPHTGSVKLAPVHLSDYLVFVQSTSSNRKLKGGTKFLYEVPDWAY